MDTFEVSAPGSGDQVSLPIDQSDTALVRLIKKKMENISMQPCIFRTSNNNNNTTSMPKLVSIGPYNHGRESLKATEEHKWNYSFVFLSRKQNLEERLENCVKGLRELEYRASICYADELNLTSAKFVEIMLIDGCFIIELFIRYWVKSLRQQDDPFFGRKGKISALRLDMIMIENQIPFFVLQMLFSLAPIPDQCSLSLNELAYRFFKSIVPGDNAALAEDFSHYGYHFLNKIQYLILPPTNKNVMVSTSSKMIKSATNLEQSGITLKVNSKHHVTLLDIEFSKGVLAIPRLKIQQSTETLLRNLIEFEQCWSSVGNATAQIRSYVLLMHNLMRSEKDVELLEKKGIVKSYAGDRKAVADMFEKMCSGYDDVKQNLYAELCEQVNAHKRKSWFKWGRKEGKLESNR